MGSIIEFLFSNMFIVVLLIGGLVSVFNRNKRQQQGKEDSSEKKERPVFDWETIFQENKPEKEPQNSPSRGQEEATVSSDELQTSDTYDRYEKKREELREQAINAEEKMKQLGNSPVFEEQIGTSLGGVPSASKPHPRFSSLSRKDVVDGIIWSEVLGPPKSRQYFQHKSRYHHSYRKKS
ncbi:hypothetical protein [Bacillus piscicola]|uniref:hypothetical protein n=1 Tax=Bacillus piscicola TaxID=1632684 RepID=UPI001F0967FF|nr:hypothetical protein [Bacillus piscicola]